MGDRGLLSIGDFSRLAGLSPKRVRRYADQGLIAPVRVDPDSGYRWFSAEQAADARLIVLLRDLDMPLELISGVLSPKDPDERWRRIRLFWSEQRQLVAERERVLIELHAALTGAELLPPDCGLLEGMSKDAVEALSRVLVPLSMPADTPLFVQGDVSHAAFVIQFGEVRVVLEKEGMATMEMARLGPGEVIGEMGLLDGKPRSASVYTSKPSRLLKLTLRDFDAVAGAHPEVAERLRAVADRRRPKR